MHAIPLLIALFFAAPADAGEFESKLAIALALADTDKHAEVSVVKSPEVKPPTRLPGHTKKAEPAYKEVRVTKYRMVRKKVCNGRSCSYRMVREPYTVIERVPIASKTGGYPTTPKQNLWTQGGKRITWKHLTTGEHAGLFDESWLRTLSDDEIQQLHADHHENKVQWSYVVRPH